MSSLAPEVSPALPSPKCVVLFGDGFSPSRAGAKCPNLDKLVSDGCTGPLMVRSGAPEGRSLREFAQLTNLYNALYEPDGTPKFELSENGQIHSSTPPSFTQENFNLQTHLITSSPTTYKFCERLGFPGLSSLPTNLTQVQPDALFSRISEILYNKANGKTNDTNSKTATNTDNKIENVCVHLQTDGQGDSIVHGIHILDRVVELLRSHYEDLFIIVVVGYGDNTEVELPFSSLNSHGNVAPRLLKLIPPQSYTTSNGKTITNIRETSPLFAVYYHRYFTRRDKTKNFDEKEFAEKNGNGKMIADAFYPEIAFKQGKMPKYGA